MTPDWPDLNAVARKLAPGWGRQEVRVPADIEFPPGTKTFNLSTCLVYHGRVEDRIPRHGPGVVIELMDLEKHMPRKKSKKVAKKRSKAKKPTGDSVEILGQQISKATDDAAREKFLAVSKDLCEKLRNTYEVILGNQLPPGVAKELRCGIAARIYKPQSMIELWEEYEVLRDSYRQVIVTKLLQAIGRS